MLDKVEAAYTGFCVGLRPDGTESDRDYLDEEMRRLGQENLSDSTIRKKFRANLRRRLLRAALDDVAHRQLSARATKRQIRARGDEIQRHLQRAGLLRLGAARSPSSAPEKRITPRPLAPPEIARRPRSESNRRGAESFSSLGADSHGHPLIHSMAVPHPSHACPTPAPNPSSIARWRGKRPSWIRWRMSWRTTSSFMREVRPGSSTHASGPDSDERTGGLAASVSGSGDSTPNYRIPGVPGP